jgi:hypothetical protein
MSDVGTVDEWVGVAKQAKDGDDTAIPRFYIRSVLNKARTREDGVQRYMNKPFVEIIIPGDQKNIVDCPVQDSHKERWPREWAEFRARGENRPQGIQIEAWGELDPALRDELKYQKFLTVEQIASASDLSLQKIHGGIDIRKAAQRYLKPRPENERALLDENEKLRHEVENLKAKMDQILANQRAEHNKVQNVEESKFIAADPLQGSEL